MQIDELTKSISSAWCFSISITFFVSDIFAFFNKEIEAYKTSRILIFHAYSRAYTRQMLMSRVLNESICLSC